MLGDNGKRLLGEKGEAFLKLDNVGVNHPDVLKNDIKFLIKKIGTGMFERRQYVVDENEELTQNPTYQKEKGVIMAGTRALYQLELLLQRLEQTPEGTTTKKETPTESKKTSPITSEPKVEQSETEQPHIQGIEIPGNQIKDTFRELYAAKNSAELKKSLTPELTQKALEHLLAEVDKRIAQAKRLNDKEKDLGLLYSSNNVSVFGTNLAFPQRILGAVEGKILSEDEIQTMSPVDLFKRAFGYDIKKDKRRAELLKKYTDMLG